MDRTKKIECFYCHYKFPVDDMIIEKDKAYCHICDRNGKNKK